VTRGAGEGAGARPAAARPSLVVAVIDIGSNSVLLLTVAVAADGRAHALDEALATTRLGAGLHAGGRLDPAARDRTLAAVADLVARARRSGASHVWPFATAAVRDAADGAAFAGTVTATAGVALEVLAGEREATLAYAAVAAGLGWGDAPLLVADLGGRTTELTLGLGGAPQASVSLPLGALALSEVPEAKRPGLVEAALAGSGLPARARESGARLAASGGTATALAAVDLGLATYDPRRVHGHVLHRTALGELGARGAAAGPPLLDPGRAAVLPAGALILERLSVAAGAAQVRVSDHGVRHAYLGARLAALGIAADLRELWA
jgi:exopolyphosphatase/guanosine-5'-triphosphate,3'-diphosphate pyrophosphatase